MYVNHVMLDGERICDTNKIHYLFLDEIVEVFLIVPLFESERVNKLNYVEDQIDCYAIKLEYNRMTRYFV
jgi:hypothetical protein